MSSGPSKLPAVDQRRLLVTLGGVGGAFFARVPSLSLLSTLDSRQPRPTSNRHHTAQKLLARRCVCDVVLTSICSLFSQLPLIVLCAVEAALCRRLDSVRSLDSERKPDAFPIRTHHSAIICSFPNKLDPRPTKRRCSPLPPVLPAPSRQPGSTHATRNTG